MPFTLGAFIGFVLGTILMFFLWVACEAHSQKKSVRNWNNSASQGIFPCYKN